MMDVNNLAPTIVVNIESHLGPPLPTDKNTNVHK